MALEIEIVPCLSDNYAYLVKSGSQCAVIDPSEPAPVRAALTGAASEGSTTAQASPDFTR